MAVFQSVGSLEEAEALVNQLNAQASDAESQVPSPEGNVSSPEAEIPSPTPAGDRPQVPLAEAIGVVPDGTVDTRSPIATVDPTSDQPMHVQQHGVGPEFMELFRDKSVISQLKTPAEQRPPDLDKKSPEYNTLPLNMPEGLTQIQQNDYPLAVQALAGSFRSMNQMGMILDPMERSAYAVSVMSNDSLRSDVKAQLIDQAMRDGKIVPEALSKDWYEARNIILRPPIQPGTPVDPRLIEGA